MKRLLFLISLIFVSCSSSPTTPQTSEQNFSGEWVNSEKSIVITLSKTNDLYFASIKINGEHLSDFDNIIYSDNDFSFMINNPQKPLFNIHGKFINSNNKPIFDCYLEGELESNDINYRFDSQKLIFIKKSLNKELLNN